MADILFLLVISGGAVLGLTFTEKRLEEWLPVSVMEIGRAHV